MTTRLQVRTVLGPNMYPVFSILLTVSMLGDPLMGEVVLDVAVDCVGEDSRDAEHEPGGVALRGVEASFEPPRPARPNAVLVLELEDAEDGVMSPLPQQSVGSGEAQRVDRSSVSSESSEVAPGRLAGWRVVTHIDGQN